MSGVSIYMIKNIASGKRYIGQSANPKHRFSVHKSPCSVNLAVQNAIKKHGVDSFLFKVLANGLARQEANEAERYLIKSLGTIAPHGYNIAPGGDASVAGWRWSDATREKRRLGVAKRKSREAPPLESDKLLRFKNIVERFRIESVRAYWSSADAKNKHRNVLANPETRKKMSASAVKRLSRPGERRISIEHMRAMSSDPVLREKADAARRAFWKNNARAVEKQSSAARAAWDRPGFRERMSAMRSGRTATLKTRKLQSEKIRQMWADPAYRQMMLNARRSHKGGSSTP